MQLYILNVYPDFFEANQNVSNTYFRKPIIFTAIAAVQKEAMETGLEHATKTRMISSVAILCLIPMIMIGLAIAADRDIAVH